MEGTKSRMNWGDFVGWLVGEKNEREKNVCNITNTLNKKWDVLWYK